MPAFGPARWLLPPPRPIQGPFSAKSHTRRCGRPVPSSCKHRARPLLRLAIPSKHFREQQPLLHRHFSLKSKPSHRTNKLSLARSKVITPDCCQWANTRPCLRRPGHPSSRHLHRLHRPAPPARTRSENNPHKFEPLYTSSLNGRLITINGIVFQFYQNP